MKKKLTIKGLVSKLLREGKEPFFYLAPDIIGSINNPVRDDKKGIVIIGLNMTGGDKMKLIVPTGCYDRNKGSDETKASFVNRFLDGAKEVDSFEDIDDLNEIVDEYGNLYNDLEDKPADTRSNPGFHNTKSGDQASRQFISRYQRLISPLGYGGVVW